VARQTTALEAQVSPTIACTREIREGQLVYSIDNPGGFASYLRCEPLAAIIVDEAPLDRLSTVFYLAPGAGRQELPPALIVSEVEMDDTTGIGTVGVPGPAKGHLGALRVELPTPQDVRSWVSKVRSGRKDSANCQLSVLVRIELDIHYGDAVGGHHHLYGSDWFGTAYPAGTNPAITASFFQKMVTPRRDAPMPLLEWDRAAEDSIEQLRELLPRRTGIYPLHTKPTAIYLEPGRTGGQTLP
jgi:hypothetical protein